MTQTADPAGHRGATLGLPATGPGSLASTGRRVIALFLDWMAATLVVRLLLPDLAYGSPGSGFAILGVFALEVSLFTWLLGSSFGQRLVGVAVVGRTRRLGLPAVLLRTLLVCLVLPPLIWDSNGRGLHDRAVDSLTIRR